MPIITKISTQKRKGRYNIFIDNEYAFSVSERTLAEKRLLKGTELSTEDIKEIKKAESDSHAIQLAMSYLSYQPRSVYEILEYLNKHEISQDASQAAVQNLIELNYLNDNNFARLFIKNNLRVGKDGPRAVDRKLKQKGLAADVIQEALKYLDLTPDQTLIDAYAGVGTLGILASDQVRQVIGIESIPEAVIDAQENCHLNHVRNAEYIQGNVEKLLPELKNQGVPIDALIVDPPRTGLSKKLIKTLLEVKPETFVYVSCNPATLAKDLVLLSEAYDVRVIQPVDMMPQTPRWEGVTKLVLRKNK